MSLPAPSDPAPTTNAGTGRPPVAVAGLPAGIAAGPPDGAGTTGHAPDGEYLDGELSWLEFAARLLDRAADERFPLLERARFLALFSEGLDEFFQVRVAGLEDQVAAGVRSRGRGARAPSAQLGDIAARVDELVARRCRILSDEVVPGLARSGVVLASWDDLAPVDRAELSDFYTRLVFPVLTPLAVYHGHPFPYISNLSLNLVVRVVEPRTGEERVARVKVPPLLPRFVGLSDGRRFVPVADIIAAHLDSLFPAMTVVEHHAFRVTRNADLAVAEHDAEDLLAAVEQELHRRRFGQAVRLEVAATIPDDLLALLVAEVDVPEGNVSVVDGPVDLSGLRVLAVDRPDLDLPPWEGMVPPAFATGEDVFDVLDRGDVLVHHPYESFTASVEAFVSRAADDRRVTSIHQTLYRTGAASPVVDALIRASRAGKQVTAVVELQARFDERANIAWARMLEEAGVKVVYGLAAVKTHAKVCLVERDRPGADGPAHYAHIGTGNYNADTARAYEDLGLFTADPAIGAELAEVFAFLTGTGVQPVLDRVAVAPLTLRSRLLAAIDAETRAGAGGRIVGKVSGLTDPEVIDALYRASAAGVAVDLVVRGRCCLRPGVPGLSEGIRVRSIVGRYLEHSRLFLFGGTPGRPVRVLLGSPDVMERNLDRRVEVLVPVDDPALQVRLAELVEALLADEVNAWSLGPDGRWTRVRPAALGRPPFDAQADGQRRAVASVGDRPGRTYDLVGPPVSGAALLTKPPPGRAGPAVVVPAVSRPVPGPGRRSPLSRWRWWPRRPSR